MQNASKGSEPRNQVRFGNSKQAIRLWIESLAPCPSKICKTMDDRLLEQNNLMYQGHGWLQYTAAFPIFVKVIRGLLQDQGSLKKIHGFWLEQRKLVLFLVSFWDRHCLSTIRVSLANNQGPLYTSATSSLERDMLYKGSHPNPETRCAVTKKLHNTVCISHPSILHLPLNYSQTNVWLYFDSC